MLSFDEALEVVLARSTMLGRERLSLREAAGRVLAEDIRAPRPMPAFDYSAMDGYALASSNLSADYPQTLRVAGVSAAGAEAPQLEARAACRIFTGAELPAGADVVIPQEDVRREGDAITLMRPAEAGRFIRRRGEDLSEGSVGLEAGLRLGPGQLALAAALDRAELVVSRRPTVAILCSGDELRAPGSAAGRAAIPDCNGVFVAAAAERAGALARLLPFMPDDAGVARKAVGEELDRCDLLVTVGGVSVGDRDVVRAALEASGVIVHAHKVAMKPGKPVLFGASERTRVLGLPGNPASAALTFLLFGVPLLRALQGERRVVPDRKSMPLGRRLSREPGRIEFIRATVERRPNGAHDCIVPLPNQASGAATTFARATHLIVAPAERGSFEEGEEVATIAIDAVFAG